METNMASTSESNHHSHDMFQSSKEFSPTFTKRAGTTDRGKDYEHLYMAYLILKLLSDNNIENFYLSSNDKNFGSFDDVVVEIKYSNNNETEVFACQLKQKQSNKRILTSSALTASKGGFSIKEYFQDYQKNKTVRKPATKMILFTSCSAEMTTQQGETSTIELCFDNTPFEVNISSVTQNELLKTSTEGSCYMFSSPEKKYEDFFGKFCLYTGQANVYRIEKEVFSMFKKMFNCDESIFKEYINFIVNWSLIEGKKSKINKMWIKEIIASQVLSPFIQPLCFIYNSSVGENTKQFREAVAKFPVTVFNKNSYSKVKKIYQDIITELKGIEKINVRAKYQLILNTINDYALNKEDKETSKVLWFLGKCPLVVNGCPAAYKVIRFCKEKKFIILTSRSEDLLQDEETFKTLSDLKRKDMHLYTYILENFTYSLEKQKEETLKILMQENEELADAVTTNELVQMLDGPLAVGNKWEALPTCHITRTLSKIIIDFVFLKDCIRNNLSVISCVEDVNVLKRFRGTKIIHIKDLREETLGTNGSGKEQFDNNIIYVSDSECSEEMFQKMCAVNPQIACHHLRYINNECLEWIRSNKNVAELQRFRVENTKDYFIRESDVFRSTTNNNINVICANPGMGKSTLMKSLKISGCSSVWTILIYARNHALHFQKNGADVDKFIAHILSDTNKENKNLLDKKCFKLLTKQQKIQMIWDGLDEVSDGSLKCILTIIEAASQNGIKQWITSRNNLKDMLETRFNILSRNIKEFDEKEQESYIEERLNLSSEELSDILNKIKKNIQLFSHNDILGIPLQIYMLTELFRRDKIKYMDLLEEVFSVADLYEHFVEEKFKVYYEEKEKCDRNIEANFQRREEETTYRMNCYKQAAYEFYFKKACLQNFGSCFSSHTTEVHDFLKEIRNGQDSVGLILTVTENGSPEFVHNSYGEYFAALFLSENYENKVRNKYYICDERYNNIRFFLDLIVSKNSKGHIAVLYKNCHLLDQCTNEDLNRKDQVGRGILEVSCAWSKNYPLLETQIVDIVFHVDDSKFRKNKNINNLGVNYFSKIASKINDAPAALKKLMLLLPFSVQLYNIQTKCFADLYIPTILFYTTIFDFSTTLECFPNIPLVNITGTSTSVSTNFLDLAFESKSVNTLKRIVTDPAHIRDLRLNFYSKRHLFDNISHCFDENVILDINDDTILHYACRYRLDEVLIFLLSHNRNVNISNKYGEMPLHYACQNINLQIVKRLFAKDADLNVRDTFGRTPIIPDAFPQSGFGSVGTVSLLIEKGAKLNVPDVEGKYPIHLACLSIFDSAPCFGHDYCWFRSWFLPVICLLVENGGSVNIADKSGKMPIHYILSMLPNFYQCLSHTDWYDTIELLINGENVEAVDKCGKTPMHYICQKEKSWHEVPNTNNFYEKRYAYIAFVSRIIELLIENGAKLNTTDRKGKMPIHYSCQDNLCETTQMLIKNGADVNAADRNGAVPMHYACINQYDSFGMVKLLTEHGASQFVMDENGKLPIHYACKESWPQTIKSFSKYAEAKHHDNLCKFCSTEIMKLFNFYLNYKYLNTYSYEDCICRACEGVGEASDRLVQKKVDVDRKLNYKVYESVKKCVRTPISLLNQIRVNVADNNGKMPLHYACQYSIAEITKKLIESGSSLDTADNEGKTPLHYAYMNEYDSFEMVKLLIKNGAKTDVVDKNGKLPKQYVVHPNCTNYNSQLVRLSFSFLK